MKFSEIIGRQLLGEDGAAFGYVRGVYAQNGAIRCLACADNEEREFFADMRDVAIKGGKLYFTDSRKAALSSVCLRLGQPCFTEGGRFMGYVKDIIAEKGAIKSYVIGGKKYPLAQLNVGDVVVIKAQRVLKEDVIKGGEIILKKGTALDGQALERAAQAGEYVQAQLKSL